MSNATWQQPVLLLSSCRNEHVGRCSELAALFLPDDQIIDGSEFGGPDCEMAVWQWRALLGRPSGPNFVSR